ncbi:HD-GYP domain-containing protein [Streptomyces cinnamoneus]|uniref:Metal-dependent phosphohydrolase n=1 Tax=Streptomyces cinnamoneus TaxID=53446 RepID=A0A918TTB7_STRCJ|nr:HD-GYP domain-containing protein [Streptomyces cinnamoneus]GHC61052.1 metal-dependent phosphohydrolase [Streptomyces cinnamoneus]
MWALPAAARVYITCAVLAAAVCAVPAVREAPAVPWGTVVLLAGVGAACERLPRCPLTVPVLLAGAFLLPPGAAALVAAAGGLAGRPGREPAGVRRLWHAAQSSLAAGAASYVYGLGAPRVLEGPAFPRAVLPALAAALVLALVAAALDGGVLVTAEGRSPRTAWRRPLPEVLLPPLSHGPTALLTAVLWHGPYGRAAALLVLLPMAVTAWVLDRCRRERAAHQATVRALVQAVDLKDHYTRGHSERVGRASVLIARELGISGDRLEALRFAGTLHDVGKLGVPTRVLRKDGPLTPEERRAIELHPEYGHEMVRGIGFLDEARAAILHHHERLDGSGYPYGLAGRQIPESARVVAVADAFDAMTSTRSYSRARPVPVALAELQRCSGSQFDPRMVAALSRALDRHGWRPAEGAAELSPLRPPGRTPASRNVPLDHCSTASPASGEARPGGRG